MGGIIGLFSILLSLAGLGLIVFIIMRFNELADATGQSKWKFIPAGVFSYMLGSFVVRTILSILVGFKFMVSFGGIIIALVGMAAGAWISLQCYRYFEDNHERLEFATNDDILDDQQPRSNRTQKEPPAFKKGNKYKKDIIDDIFDNAKDIRK